MTTRSGFVPSPCTSVQLSSSFTPQRMPLKRCHSHRTSAATRSARLIPIAASTGTGVRQVSADEAEASIKASARPTLFVASATWCGPCQFLAPELDTVAGIYKDSVDILKMDTDEYPDMASAMLVRGLPSLYFIQNAKLLYKMEGAVPAVRLEQMINFFFFNGPRPEGLTLPGEEN